MAKAKPATHVVPNDLHTEQYYLDKYPGVLTHRSILYARDRGRLPTWKMGHRVFFSEADVEALFRVEAELSWSL